MLYALSCCAFIHFLVWPLARKPPLEMVTVIPPPRMRPYVSIHIPASQQVDRTSPCTLMYVDVQCFAWVIWKLIVRPALGIRSRLWIE